MSLDFEDIDDVSTLFTEAFLVPLSHSTSQHLVMFLVHVSYCLCLY